MRTVELPSGETIPALGQGTWMMGEDPARRREEIAALRTGISLGMTLIDTAEMYGDGATEELVGTAIDGRREQVFLVSKVLPQNATLKGTVAACERSLRRLGTDRLDLYLLHWREEPTPLEETLTAFTALMSAGKIRGFGVSNFDTGDIEDLLDLPGGDEVQTDQVLYNLARRGIEWDLLPCCRSRKIAVMAYSPVERGRLGVYPALGRIAARHGATPAQIALAWLLRNGDVCAIPKAATPAHVQENRRALEVQLSADDLRALDRQFPPPRGPQPLELS